jgi:hypothetical protein
MHTHTPTALTTRNRHVYMRILTQTHARTQTALIDIGAYACARAHPNSTLQHMYLRIHTHTKSTDGHMYIRIHTHTHSTHTPQPTALGVFLKYC